MKNKALKILISVVSVVAVIGAGLLLGLLISFASSIISDFNPNTGASYILDLIQLIVFITTFLCIPVCGVLTFLYVNSFISNGDKVPHEIEKAEREVQKKEQERERKKQLLEKLKSELGEE